MNQPKDAHGNGTDENILQEVVSIPPQPYSTNDSYSRSSPPKRFLSLVNLIRNLPQEIVIDQILGRYCDGKSLSTLALVAITAIKPERTCDATKSTPSNTATSLKHIEHHDKCDENGHDDVPKSPILTPEDIYSRLVWDWIPTIGQRRLNAIVDNIEQQTNLLSSITTSPSSSSAATTPPSIIYTSPLSYAQSAINWIRTISNSIKFEKRRNLIASWKYNADATPKVTENGKDDDELDKFYNYMEYLMNLQNLCTFRRQMLELSKLLAVLQYMEYSIRSYSSTICSSTNTSSIVYCYEWPVWCGTIEVDIGLCTNAITGSTDASEQLQQKQKQNQRRCVNVVVTTPITDKPFSPYVKIPGYGEILDSASQQQQNHCNKKKTHLFRCEPHNVVPIKPCWGKIYGLSLDDQLMLNNSIGPVLLHTDQVAVPRQTCRDACRNIRYYRNHFDVRILTQYQSRTRQHSRSPNYCYSRFDPTDWFLGEGYDHNSSCMDKCITSTNNYPTSSLICCWDNEDEDDYIDDEYQYDEYQYENFRDEYQHENFLCIKDRRILNFEDRYNDDIDSCITYMIKLLKRIDELSSSVA